MSVSPCSSRARRASWLAVVWPNESWGSSRTAARVPARFGALERVSTRDEDACADCTGATVALGVENEDAEEGAPGTLKCGFELPFDEPVVAVVATSGPDEAAAADESGAES